MLPENTGSIDVSFFFFFFFLFCIDILFRRKLNKMTSRSRIHVNLLIWHCLSNKLKENIKGPNENKLPSVIPELV